MVLNICEIDMKLWKLPDLKCSVAGIYNRVIVCFKVKCMLSIPHSVPQFSQMCQNTSFVWLRQVVKDLGISFILCISIETIMINIP